MNPKTDKSFSVSCASWTVLFLLEEILSDAAVRANSKVLQPIRKCVTMKDCVNLFPLVMIRVKAVCVCVGIIFNSPDVP